MCKNQLIAATQRACHEVSELKFALFTPARTFKKLFLSFNYPLSYIIITTLPILSTLQIVNLGGIIVETNTIKAIILIIAMIITIIAISHKEKSIIFVEKKVVVLIKI